MQNIENSRLRIYNFEILGLGLEFGGSAIRIFKFQG